MTNNTRIRPTLILLAALMFGHAAVHAQTVTELSPDSEEEVRRYAVEIILFTYADSVSAGTEVFLADVPELLPGQSATGDVPYFGDTPEFATSEFGDERDDDSQNYSKNQRQDDFAKALENELERNRDNDLEVEIDGARDVDPESDIENENVETELEEIVVGASSVDFKLLPPDALSMQDIHDNLQRLDAYQPILWTGWTQIVLEESVSPALQLRRLGNVPLAADGSLTLYVGRFVHLVVDVALDSQQSQTLEYDDRLNDNSLNDSRQDNRRQYDSQPSYGSEPTNSDDSATDFGYFEDSFRRQIALPIVYRIQEDSIMRNGETRYFDHPKFGLIARLTLVEDDPDSDGLLPDLLPGVDRDSLPNDDQPAEPQPR